MLRFRFDTGENDNSLAGFVHQNFIYVVSMFVFIFVLSIIYDFIYLFNSRK